MVQSQFVLLSHISFVSAIIGFVAFILLQVLPYRIALVYWCLPLLISATICRLCYVSDNVKNAALTSSSSPTTPTKVTPTSSNAFYQHIKLSLQNDNRSTLYFLSAVLILLPGSAYFLRMAIRHLTEEQDPEEPYEIHEHLADDMGKVSGAFLCLLLFPVSRYNAVFAVFGVSEVNAVRLHICAGRASILAALAHGIYYTVIWVKMENYTFFDVFPDGTCWRGIGTYGMEDEAEEECQDKFVNLAGVIAGALFLIQLVTSLHSIRRTNYKLFYNIHVAVSLALLVPLVCHYSRMIYYFAPGMLHYLGCNVPLWVESWCTKWKRRGKGGVLVKKVTCVPDSGGCVDIEFMLDGGDYEVDGDRGVEEGNLKCQLKVTPSASSSTHPRSIYDTVGQYIKLHIPEISSQSHPFTIFAHSLPDRHSQNESVNSMHILFRPVGSFTKELAQRLKVLTLLPKQSKHQSNTNSTCPRMFMNGVRANTLDMLVKATNTHDKVVIIAGGVGITPYISLLHAIRQLSIATMLGKKEMSPNTAHDEDSTDASSCSTAKCIDVHWLSREEGLIRHVLKYLEPYRHVAKDVWNGTPPMTINFTVHHTSKTLPKMESFASTNSLSRASDDEPTNTWQPTQVNPSACPFATSSFEWNPSSPKRNALNAATYAFIVFGGMGIVHACVTQVQQKHVFQTRPVALVSALGFAFIAALLSYGVVLFVSSKSRVGDDVKGEIELKRMTTNEKEDSDFEAFTSFVFDEQRSDPASSALPKSKDNAVMSISHSQGRPDLDAIVRDAVDDGGVGKRDVGLFMCGPDSMSKRIRDAVRREEDNNRLCVPGGPMIAVYQEFFEF